MSFIQAIDLSLEINLLLKNYLDLWGLLAEKCSNLRLICFCDKLLSYYLSNFYFFTERCVSNSSLQRFFASFLSLLPPNILLTL